MKKNLITFKRNIFPKVILLLLVFLTTACNNDDDNGKDSKDDKETECVNSEHEGYRTVVQGDNTREYILHVPSSYDSNTPTPLVINFHGFGDCAANYAMNVGDFYELNSVADDNNFLVAYPQGVVREKESPEWDPGDNSSTNINENDPYFTEQLIASINSEFNVDLSRVYATGYSNGGMMSYGLACTRSDIIAAAGIMSGVMLGGDCTPNEYTSIIHFHGVADEVLPIEGNDDYQSVSEGIDFWREHNNIPAANIISTELNNGDVVRETYAGGNENTAVILYTINSEFGKEGGHVWFSEDIDGVSPNKRLWDFLSTYSLDD